MNDTIEIQHLSKSFGSKQALRDISLTIPTGIFGLLGRNGAGKTTFLRILAGVLQQTGGSVMVCGIPISHVRDVRRMTGYLPQDFSFYPELTVWEVLDYLGVLSEMSASERARRIPLVLKAVNLQSQKKTKFAALSGGMKRRLGIAQALLHEPRILIADEPTVGLDPEERVRFRHLLSEIAQNRIVILSTHIVDDIEKICTRVAVLDDGKLLFCGKPSDFTNSGESLESAYIRRIGDEV